MLKISGLAFSGLIKKISGLPISGHEKKISDAHLCYSADKANQTLKFVSYYLSGTHLQVPGFVMYIVQCFPCLGIVTSMFCLVLCLSSCPKFVMYIVCHVKVSRVEELSCPGIVLSSVCRVQGLSFPGLVLSRDCHVQGLSYLGFVLSRVCTIQGL
jgi:hypothetical protein